jgi:hypothetical protein
LGGVPGVKANLAGFWQQALDGRFVGQRSAVEGGVAVARRLEEE